MAGKIKQFHVIEIISSKRKDTAGRVLLLGTQNNRLLRSIDDDIVLGKRFGTLGLTRNDSPKSFGIPILSKGEPVYYLIGTYLKAQRAVPFRGCLVGAEQLRESGNNLLGFLDAWERFLENSEPVELETYKPGTVTLELHEHPVHTIPGSVKKMEIMANDLKEGKTVRFFHRDRAVEFIRFLLSGRDERFKYAWTAAPFDFPSEPDGARFHIGVIPDGKKYENKREGVTLLENYAVSMAPGKNRIVTPIILETVEPPAQTPMASQFKRFLKKLKFLPFLLAVSLGLFLVVSSLLNSGGADGCKSETWLRRNLGEISFRQPLPEQVEAVCRAKEVLTNPHCDTDPVQTCKRLLGTKIGKIQDIFADKIQSEWRFVDFSEILLKKWFEIIKETGNLEFKNKPGLEDYKKELTRLAGKGLRNFVLAQTRPNGESIKNLDYASLVTGKYPVEFSPLAREAKQLSHWIETEIQVRELWPRRMEYKDFKYIHNLLEESSPPEICQSTFHKLRSDNITHWTYYQLPRTKSLYNNMIGLKQDFDRRRLSNEFKKLFDIPGQRKYYSTARKVFGVLNEFKRKKTVTVKAFKMTFSGYFKKKIKSYYEDKKKKNESNESTKKVEKPRVTLKFYSQGNRYNTIVIKNRKDFSMPLKVSFYSSLSIKVSLDYRTVCTLNYRIDLFNRWLKREGRTEEIVLKDPEGHEVMTFKYKIPTARQLGLKHWD